MSSWSTQVRSRANLGHPRATSGNFGQTSGKPRASLGQSPCSLLDAVPSSTQDEFADNMTCRGVRGPCAAGVGWQYNGYRLRHSPTAEWRSPLFERGAGTNIADGRMK